MFEHRSEAEMRLYSEKTARELALQRLRKEGGDHGDTPDKSDSAEVNSDFLENGDISESDGDSERAD